MTQTFDTPLTTTDQAIDRLLAAGLPVLLVFHAGGAPGDVRREMERIARERAGRLLVVQADMRDAPVAARRFSVGRTPALVDVRDGAPVGRADGIAAGDLETHAKFLLGEGPKPEARTTEAGAGGRATVGPDGQPAGKPVPVTDVTFERDVLRAASPVLVDFWAPWCGPCRITDPMVERLAKEQAGRIIVAKVNVDENPRVAERFGIQAIPTMLVVKDGKVIDQWSGALPESALRARIAAVLS